jgi:hypothetical protein
VELDVLIIEFQDIVKLIDELVVDVGFGWCGRG